MTSELLGSIAIPEMPNAEKSSVNGSHVTPLSDDFQQPPAGVPT